MSDSLVQVKLAELAAVAAHAQEKDKRNLRLVYPLIRDGGFLIPEDGWVVLGFSDAPYPSSCRVSKAIVFEKVAVTAQVYGDVLSEFEPGVYWCHGDIELFEIKNNESEVTK